MIYKNISDISSDNGLSEGITLSLLSDVINKTLFQYNGNILIGTSGSLGREERYSELSDIELLLYFKNNLKDIDFLYEIKNVFSSKIKILLEYKTINLAHYYEGINSKTFFPSRFVDFHKLYGTENFFEDILSKFILNIKNMNKSEKKSWKGRISFHRKISENLSFKRKGEKFDLLDRGEKKINYLDNEDKEISIKIGMLRFIQYTVVEIILKLIKEGKIDEKSFPNIGKRINEKLDFISDFNTDINFNEITELKLLYNYFLNIHNKIVKEFFAKGEGEVYFSDDEFKIFTENLDDFNLLVKKIRLK